MYHGLMIFMDENVDEKMIMDELFNKHLQQVLFCEKLNKINKIQEIYVDLL
jgi:hypothetical protein